LASLATDTAVDPAILAKSRGPVAVFSPPFNDNEGEIVRGLLESEGIPAIYDNHAGIMVAYSLKLSDAPTGNVFVSPNDERRARELIAAYLQPFSDEEISDAADASGS